MNRNLAAGIVRRVEQLLEQALPLCQRHGKELPAPRCLFDLRGQTAGQARWLRGRQPELRFNLQLAATHTEDFLRQTVPHEVAHLVTLACFERAAPHGPEWRSVMQAFGIDRPQRCHRYRVEPENVRRQRQWAYRCGCARHLLSTTRHNRVRRGLARYHCRQCGEALTPAE